VVEGRLAGARRRVDQHEPPANAIAHRVPETGASVEPLRPNLVADDKLARAGGSAEELLRGLVVLSGAHSSCPFSVRRGGRSVPHRGQARWTRETPTSSSPVAAPCSSTTECGSFTGQSHQNWPALDRASGGVAPPFDAIGPAMTGSRRARTSSRNVFPLFRSCCISGRLPPTRGHVSVFCQPRGRHSVRVGTLDAERVAYTAGAGFTPLTMEVQLRNKVRASVVRSSTDGPPRTSTRQCCPGPIGCMPVIAPVAKTMPARTG
jgi:hypothetical protein